jgi:hypothetical protein
MMIPPAQLPWIPVDVKSDRSLVTLYRHFRLDSSTTEKMNPNYLPQTRCAAVLTQRMNAATIAHYLPKRY